jgi:hypothetical protein
MQDIYDQITETFGRAPTTWCSFENKDNVTHATFAYYQLGMLWRNGFIDFVPNVGTLTERRWPEFWSKISEAQMVYPSFTHNTDELIMPPEYYSIGYENFTRLIIAYGTRSTRRSTILIIRPESI